MLIFKFRTDSLIICSSDNFFVNNLCAAETYAINFFKISVIFAFFIFFISSSLFEICQLRSKKNSEFTNFEQNDKINIFNDFLL